VHLVRRKGVWLFDPDDRRYLDCCKQRGRGRAQPPKGRAAEDLERELHAAGVSPEEIEAGARRLLAQARGHQLAETRKQLALGQKQIAAAMGVSVARCPRSSTARSPPSRSSLQTCEAPYAKRHL
jgi:hypothetical protein